MSVDKNWGYNHDFTFHPILGSAPTMTPTDFIFSSPLITFSSLLAGYMILGGGIKYIDDAFDEKTFNKQMAILVAPLVAIFWVFMMYVSPASATILGAIFLAVALRAKVDNIGFHVGALAIVAGLFFLYLFHLIDFLWIPLIVLTIGGILDEVGNDYVDAHPKIHRGIYLFFEFRFVMKLVLLLLAIAGVYGFEYFLAFLGFDIAYASVGLYSDKLKRELKLNYKKVTI